MPSGDSIVTIGRVVMAAALKFGTIGKEKKSIAVAKRRLILSDEVSLIREVVWS